MSERYVDQHWYDREGWSQVHCNVADMMVRGQSEDSPFRLAVFSSITDPDGLYGTPVVYTEWGLKGLDGLDTPILREYRWPQDAGRDCEHWINAKQNIEARKAFDDD